MNANDIYRSESETSLKTEKLLPKRCGRVCDNTKPIISKKEKV